MLTSFKLTGWLLCIWVPEKIGSFPCATKIAWLINVVAAEWFGRVKWAPRPGVRTCTGHPHLHNSIRHHKTSNKHITRTEEFYSDRFRAIWWYINNNLDKYEAIVPCGIKDKGVTSLKKIKDQNYDQLENKLIENFILNLKD